MKAKTEELLYLALWACDTLSRPTFRNLTDSFEGWAYRNGFLRQLHRLENRQWLESQTSPTGDRLRRLTEAGRLQALGGRDPEACWRRRWDGRWRLVLFDVPEARSSTRNKLRRYLQSRGFGYLQNSVWVTPDPVHRERAILADGPVDVESLILLEACPCAGESDPEIVAGAWAFDEINQGYARHQEILLRRPRRRIDMEAAAKAFHRWLREERVAWLEAMACDPLLPEALLPPGYAGRQAWRLRQEIMAEAGAQMRAFKLT
ncbi:MAG: CRISPR-associated endonuclease Cas2 [Chloroflexi bacterium]|nr:CRISPR-associated endonuclease Cas2 [Chloroflexota bacterium]